jgi:hypothetical protein
VAGGNGKGWQWADLNRRPKAYESSDWILILLVIRQLHFLKIGYFGIFWTNKGDTGTNLLMPKRPQFDYRKTPKGWLINVPGSISNSGCRERLYFSTRDLAKAESQRLSEKYKKHGENASVIPPRVADDATKALEILSGFP